MAEEFDAVPRSEDAAADDLASGGDER
jgi:hypothetical protein